MAKSIELEIEGEIVFLSPQDKKHARMRWRIFQIGHVKYVASRTQPRVYLHREIIGARPNQLVDHVNGNGLDNRRENLRLADKRKNAQNARRRSDNTSGYKGVSWDTERKKWTAYIFPGNGHKKSLGRHATAEEAARAYDVAARVYFGPFARTNESMGAL